MKIVSRLITKYNGLKKVSFTYKYVHRELASCAEPAEENGNGNKNMLLLKIKEVNVAQANKAAQKLH